MSTKKTFDIKSRFSKRPRPSPVNHQREYKKKGMSFQLDKTTEKPSTEFEDFFGKPEPVTTVATVSEDPTTLNPKYIQPIPLSLSEQTSIFVRLQSLTGAEPVGVITDMAKPVGVTTDMAEHREHDEHDTRGLDDGEDRQMDTQATHGTSDHNTQIIHHQHRKLSENQTRPSNNERQKIKGSNPHEKVRPSAIRGIQRKVTQKRREKEKEEREELNTIAPHQRKTKKAKLIHKRSRKGKVVTLERYKYENEDGSITWGYQNNDGGYKVGGRQ